MGDLKAVLSALQGAKGPDRELDCCIYAAVHATTGNPGRWSEVGPPTYAERRFFWCPDPEMDWLGYDLLYVSPNYTASVDTCLALVAEKLPGWDWSAGVITHPTDAETKIFAARLYQLQSAEPVKANNPHSLPLAILTALFSALSAQSEDPQ